MTEAMDLRGSSTSNPQGRPLTTAALGRLVGYSTQQVRDLERIGVLPAAERSANGYRRYGPDHLVALRAYRALAAAVGPVGARRILPELRTVPVADAAAIVDDLHAGIARERAQVRAARAGLAVVLADPIEPFDDRDAMTIGELADALGIRASALRHWEREGLVHPDRRPSMRARRYDARAISEARTTAALRGGGYPIPVIAQVLAELRTRRLTESAAELLDARLADLAERSVRLLEASAHLHALLVEREPVTAGDAPSPTR